MHEPATNSYPKCPASTCDRVWYPEAAVVPLQEAEGSVLFSKQVLESPDLAGLGAWSESIHQSKGLLKGVNECSEKKGGIWLEQTTHGSALIEVCVIQCLVFWGEGVTVWSLQFLYVKLVVMLKVDFIRDVCWNTEVEGRTSWAWIVGFSEFIHKCPSSSCMRAQSSVHASVPN